MPNLKKVTVRNKLGGDVTAVRVLYAQSNKGTSTLSYTFNWSTMDVENPNCGLIKYRKEVAVGSVPRDKEASVDCVIPFEADLRGYWQVYFRYQDIPYKINKNNAQVNPWDSHDDGQYVEITLRYEGSSIRVDFVLNSGNAYFYATPY